MSHNYYYNVYLDYLQTAYVVKTVKQNYKLWGGGGEC